MTNFRRQALDRGSDDAERGKEHGVAVTRDYLRRDWFGLEPELGSDMFFDTWINIGKCSNRAGNRTGCNLLTCMNEACAAALKFRIGLRQLHSKGGWLCMNAMAASDGDGVLVLESTFLERGEKAVQIGEQQVRSAHQLNREAGVENV